MTQLKITNTMKHSFYAIWIAWAAGALHRLAWYIEPSSKDTMHMWWFIIVVGVMLMLNVERNQMTASRPERYSNETLRQYYKRWWTEYLKPYLKVRWLDTLLDLVAGIASMFAGLLPWWIL